MHGRLGRVHAPARGAFSKSQSLRLYARIHARPTPTNQPSPLHAPIPAPRSRLPAPHAESPSVEKQDEAAEAELSDKYSDVMTTRMGAALTYRHENGMNYNSILDDLIVGSCLQTASDVDVLADLEGVKTVLCLQEDSDMNYFSLNVAPIRAHCAARSDIKHLRHAIRDFDPFSLRRRLPGAVAVLSQTAAQQGGATYVHCTAGLGRAPATALAYMWWVKGVPLDDAYEHLTGIRTCKPNANAIREAAVDLLYGHSPPAIPVTLTLLRQGLCQEVKVAGLDVGWGQSVDLTRDAKGRMSVVRNLPPGKYQFKFIWDGVWAPSMDHLTMEDGGNLNNYLVVPDVDLGAKVAAARERIRGAGGDLTEEEAATIKGKLAAMVVEELTSAPTGV